MPTRLVSGNDKAAPRVFLSYVQEDGAAVRRLAEALRAYGVEVWLDRDELKPGVRWRDAIRMAISQGDFFIACFSAEYAARAKTYMNEEVTLAIEELRQRPTDRAWFIPALLSPCEISDRSIGAGETLRTLQWIDLSTDWYGGVGRILSTIDPSSAKVHVLIGELSNESARGRIRAADNLATLGPLATGAVSELTRALDDKNETVRAAAAHALGMIGHPSEATVVKLAGVIDQDEAYFSKHATEAFNQLAPTAIPLLVHALESRPQIWFGTARVLSLVSNPAAVAQLRDAMRSSAWDVRRCAIESLGRMQDKDAISALTYALTSDSTPEVRSAAIDALANILHSEAFPQLVGALQNDPDRFVRSNALRKLSKLSQPAISEYVRALECDSDAEVRLAAAEQLLCGGAEPDLAAFAAALVRLVKTGSAGIFEIAVSLLNNSGLREVTTKSLKAAGAETIGRIVENLAKRSASGNADISSKAVTALGAIGDDRSVTILLESLQNPGCQIRPHVVETLGTVQGERVSEALRNALSDVNTGVRFRGAVALGKLRDATAVPQLIRALNDQNSWVRTEAENALRQIGTPEALRALERLGGLPA